MLSGDLSVLSSETEADIVEECVGWLVLIILNPSTGLGLRQKRCRYSLTIASWNALKLKSIFALSYFWLQVRLVALFFSHQTYWIYLG